MSNTFYKMKDVGHLIVKVIKAQGLHSVDLGGKSDPFAVRDKEHKYEFLGKVIFVEFYSLSENGFVNYDTFDED